MVNLPLFGSGKMLSNLSNLFCSLMPNKKPAFCGPAFCAVCKKEKLYFSITIFWVLMLPSFSAMIK